MTAPTVDAILDAAVKRAIRSLRAGLRYQMRIDLLTGGKSAERMLGPDSVRREVVEVTA